MTLQAQSAMETGDRMTVEASNQVDPITTTLFYKEHITDTLDFLKRAYSEKQCADKRAERGDEYITLKAGGTNKHSNLRLVCRSCNGHKGVKILTTLPLI